MRDEEVSPVTTRPGDDATAVSAMTGASDGRLERQRGHTADEITRRLIRAIFEHRLSPGTRITEKQLAQVFQVSRTLVRQAVMQLCELGVFVKAPNQGCTVAYPSQADARAMLEVRRIVEPEIVRRVVSLGMKADFAVLDRHIAEETEARARGNRATLVRLTGEFHLKLARIAGNVYLERLMMQLQVLTCLAVLVHAEGEVGCPRDEHGAIVALIRAGDAAGAAAEMLRHLEHIEVDLRLDGADRPRRNLDDAFRWMTSPSAEDDLLAPTEQDPASP